MKNNKTLSTIIVILIIFNLSFALFPTYKGSFIWNYFNSVQDFSSYFLIPILVINSIIFFVIVILTKINFDDRIVKSIILLEFLYIINFAFHKFIISPFSIIVLPISYLSLFYILPQYTYSQKILKFTYIVLILWSIAPLYLLLFGSIDTSIKMFTIEDFTLTFGGFATNRNEYAYYVGLTILLTLIIRFNKFLKFFLLIVLFIGIALSESRSSIIGIILALIIKYLFFNNEIKRNWFKNIPIIMLIIIIVYYFINFGARNENLMNISDRLIINKQFLTTFSNNILMGQGKPTVIQAGLDADLSTHNFITQTLIDYGIFVAFSFFYLIIVIWKRYNNNFKTILFYMLIIGLAQPYFSFGVPTYFTLCTLLIAILVQNYKEKIKAPVR